MKFSRYRVVKYLLFILPLFYLMIVGLKPVLSPYKQETIPFFSWQLFSWVPQWHKPIVGVIAHSVENESIADPYYLIPGEDIRYLKVLRMVREMCDPSFFDDRCTEIIKQTLYPTIEKIIMRDSSNYDDYLRYYHHNAAADSDTFVSKRLTKEAIDEGHYIVEFSIIKGLVNLRDIQETIRDLSEGKKRRTDYYQINSIGSSWSITEGHLEQITLSYDQLRKIGFNFKGKHLPENALTTEQFMDQALNGTRPLIHSVFDVYFKENKLIYVKSSCPLTKEPPFFLHLVPVDENDLPEARKGFSFDNLDFMFDKQGLRFEDKCMVVVPLPDYTVKTIRTGQYTNQGKLWDVSLKPQVATLLDNTPWQEIISGKPAIDSVFDVYRHQGTLVYIKESCTESDTEARFLLHFEPFDVDALPDSRQAYGFDNRDFNFSEYGVHFDGRCMAVLPLPEYEIDSIRTGQWIPGEGHIWEDSFDLTK